jgi:hypothetical protein
MLKPLVHLTVLTSFWPMSEVCAIEENLRNDGKPVMNGTLMKIRTTACKNLFRACLCSGNFRDSTTTFCGVKAKEVPDIGGPSLKNRPMLEAPMPR